MASAKSLQTPKILSIEGSTIRVQHPDISNYVRTYLSSNIAVSGTAMTVLDNNGFADVDAFIIGEVGDEKTEEDTVNGAVTRGTAVTVANTLKFAHELDAPVTRINERKITIYGSATSGGALTSIVATGSALSIQWNKTSTEYILKTTDTAYAFYVVKYYDGTTESSASDYVASTGNASNSAYAMIQQALDNTGAQASDNGEVSWSFLIRSVQDWQNYVTQWVDPKTGVKKDWSFEYIQDDTSIPLVTFEGRYALSALTSAMKYNETKQSILDVRVGNYRTRYIPVDVYDRWFDGKIYSYVTTAAAIGATSLILEDTSMFASSGTAYVHGNTITYTSKSDTTDTLSGIPASGTGSIATAIVAGDTCSQTNWSGRPIDWTIYNGYILWTIPPSSTYNGWPIKFKYIKALTAITEVSDTTEIPFFNTCQYYVSYKIELKRGDIDRATFYKNIVDGMISANSHSDKSYPLETYQYYQLEDSSFPDNRNQNWNSDVFYS